MKQTTHYASGLVWLRRDLRVADNRALLAALQSCAVVHCAFVFDVDILSPLPRADRRVAFIHAALLELDQTLRERSGKADAGLIVLHGHARSEIVQLAKGLGVQAVFAARDYEPLARQRDEQVRDGLRSIGVELHLLKDHVVLEERELLTQGAKPYTVFTPYWRAWLARLEGQGASALVACDGDQSPPLQQLSPRPPQWCKPVPSLAQIGFEPSDLAQLPIPTGERGATRLVEDFVQRMDHYGAARNYPARKGPSYLSVHLRFGTVSIRRLVALALQRRAQYRLQAPPVGDSPEPQALLDGTTTWLGELAWRDFYFQILANFPHVAHSAFKPAYDNIVWEHGEHAQALFAAWCEGRTGYPLVDAAMLQLQRSGYMHNRLRMVAGSFLVKHLGLDWRWGERYFAQALIDFDLAANNGGWQWVASSGCDAQPYFRIFNPITQSEKFDPQGTFIQRYLPVLGKLPPKLIHAPWQASPLVLEAVGLRLGNGYPQAYPLPIVDHAAARAATLARYACVKTV